MKTTINFGIDLGTTNSAIAKFDKGTLTVFKNPLNWKQTLPSVVAFRKNRIVIGEKAREFLQKDPQNVVGAFKRKMGTSDTYPIQATGEQLSPIELSAYILKELKNFVPNKEAIPAAVITIPASFDTMQSNATKKAGYQAGFQQVVLLQEPIAASLAYANQSKEALDGKKWLVYDLGGGTFDVALVTIEDEDMKVLDHEGNNYLGGTDIDKTIIEKIIIPYLERKGNFANLEKEMKNADGQYNRLYNLLLYKAEEAKILLTTSAEAEIEFETEDDTGETLDIFFTISRTELEAIIQPYIQQTIDLADKIIQRNQIDRTDLAFVLMIGGSTYIPAVRQQLKAHFKIDINCDIDPTTAVAEGAAYYAGMKIKQLPADQPTSIVTKKGIADLDINIAHSKVAKEAETVFIAEAKGELTNRFYRITRLDGGYDSGLKPLAETITEYLPLVADVYNEFSFKVFDDLNNPLEVDIPNFGITHGKFNIDGQPLPNDICLEVDALEESTTFLESVFKKNDILPVKKTVVKEISKFIGKGTDEELIINVVEGQVDNLPAANKTIGFIKISGHDLQRDLIQGSEVELTIEISESRDLMVQIYLTLSGQEFENVFSPSETHVDLAEAYQELTTFEENLKTKQKQFERQEKYEHAGGISNLLTAIEALKDRIQAVGVADVTDEKYQIDEEKRAIAKQIHAYFTQTVLRKNLERYYKIKSNLRFGLITGDTVPEDKERFEEIIANEKNYIADANVALLKMKISQLEGLIRRINSRTPVTNNDIIGYFGYLKAHKYLEKSKADALIIQGEQALSQQNYGKLTDIVNQLYFLKESEEKNDPETFRSKGTGLQ